MPETVFHEEMTEEIKQGLEDQKKPAPKEEKKPEVEAKPEPKQETKPEVKKEEKPVKDAPEVQIEKLNAALREQREESKKLREERKRDTEKLTSLEQGWNKFQEALKKTESAPPPYEKDPLENLRQEKEALRKEVDELKGFRKNQEETASRQTQMQRFQDTVRSQVYEFESRNPDYNEAFQHVVELEKSRLEALGVPAEQLAQALGAWEAQTAALALRNGKNPGEVIYQLAQRLGYKQKSAEKKPEKSLEDLKRVAEGQDASKSLSGGGGEAELSLESLATMDEEQLTQFVKKNWGKLAKAQK